MRLRELGTSQSVILVASPEAHPGILDQRIKIIPYTTEISSRLQGLAVPANGVYPAESRVQIPTLYGISFKTKDITSYLKTLPHAKLL